MGLTNGFELGIIATESEIEGIEAAIRNNMDINQLLEKKKEILKELKKIEDSYKKQKGLSSMGIELGDYIKYERYSNAR